MGIINSLVPRQRLFDGVSTSVPFTYRDGLTTLQLIECLRHNLDVLQTDFNSLIDSVNAAIDANNQDIRDMADNLIKQMAALREELIRLIGEAQDSGLAWSPVYGEQDSVSAALGGLYDNCRNHGLFWADYDNMELDASMYDALGLSAREYDIKATAVDNCLPGDFPGRSQFPYGKSIPEGEPADIYMTEVDADAKYVQRNPTVSNFENKVA